MKDEVGSRKYAFRVTIAACPKIRFGPSRSPFSRSRARAYDQASGFGRIQPLGKLAVPHLQLGLAADVKAGDLVLGVGASRGHGLAEFFRTAWRLGAAGVEAPLTLSRGGGVLHITVTSADRNDFLKKPKLH